MGPTAERSEPRTDATPTIAWQTWEPPGAGVGRQEPSGWHAELRHPTCALALILRDVSAHTRRNPVGPARQDGGSKRTRRTGHELLLSRHPCAARGVTRVVSATASGYNTTTPFA